MIKGKLFSSFTPEKDMAMNRTNGNAHWDHRREKSRNPQ